MVLYNPSQLPQSQSPRFPNGATIPEFSLSPTPTTILPDRSATNTRRRLIIFNDGTANCLFAYGTSISATAFTAELLPGGYFQDSPPEPWQGPMVARSTNSPTTINVTEITIL